MGDVEDNKFWLCVWTLVAATLLIVVGTIYTYNVKALPIENRVRIECIRHGGTWGPMQGSDSAETCDMRK